MSTRHTHDFQRLSDEAIFCSSCGKIVDRQPPPVHHCGCHHPFWTYTPSYTSSYGNTTTTPTLLMSGTTVWEG